MILEHEYLWLETVLSDDDFWNNSSIGWDVTSEITLSEVAFSIHSALTGSIFGGISIFSGSIVKFSFLDLMLITEFDKKYASRELYDLYLWDSALRLQNKYPFLNCIYYADNQDFVVTLLDQNAELLVALEERLESSWFTSTFGQSPAAVFDSINDAVATTSVRFFEMTMWSFVLLWIFIIFHNAFRIANISFPKDFAVNRISIFASFVARHGRLQFEAALQVLFYFLLYATIAILTFDEEEGETLELFDTTNLNFFLAVIAFLFFKYSTHYFAFLEASYGENQSVLMIARQFFRDFINTFALLLRFIILLIRLNVYDSLDDFYDSYFIFIGDFDEEEWVYESWAHYYWQIVYDYDAHDDKTWAAVNEHPFLFDLFVHYTITWWKLFSFIFFILEEAGRLFLAFYICYLITFEVHAANTSYAEDTYVKFVKAAN